MKHTRSLSQFNQMRKSDEKILVAKIREITIQLRKTKMFRSLRVVQIENSRDCELNLFKQAIASPNGICKQCRCSKMKWLKNMQELFHSFFLTILSAARPGFRFGRQGPPPRTRETFRKLAKDFLRKLQKCNFLAYF